ncbi:GntR family transcriptional regulator [Paraburkholderia unamae]|uniref:FadR/GntR family transcriptional regulator n=1 Tax=Paraburkholderia unamae TaxID=219649 RepID=UPI000DC31401|nr:GntR family transcriptional regulator [Paraburkholderia unamae]RAR59265.1 GntR family transcriptional regulator [Paraburkholderia unamae]
MTTLRTTRRAATGASVDQHDAGDAAPLAKRTAAKRPAAKRAAPASTAVEQAATPSEAFSPISTRRISEEINAQIRQQIASGALRPGSRLPTERELAEQFAVSRMAVREGMRTLESAGLITMKKGRHGGAFVSESSAKLVTQQIRDMLELGRATLPMLMEARLMVMDVVVRLACERATAADFRAMEANLEKTVALTEAGRLVDRTFTAIEFNKILADCTRNDIIGALVEGLSEVLRHFIVLAGPQPFSSVVDTRQKLIEQMRARDADGAALTMRHALEDISTYLIKQSRSAIVRK